MKKKITNHSIKYQFKYKKKQKKKFKPKILYKLLILFLLTTSYISLYSLKLTNSPSPKILNITAAFDEILSFEKNHIYSNEIFYDFRAINRENKLIDENIKFEKPKAPDVSVIMTVYNQAYCLYKCIRSIQNQSLKNIEIFIVDDCSMDNSVEIIKQYQKDDPRIILIEHDANEGTIKSRTDCIRKAKGKYITIIDSDDTFIHKDVLKNSLFIAQTANIDVVEFQKYTYSQGKFRTKQANFPYLDLKNIIYQPELRTKFICIQKRFHLYLRNRQITGKFIKNELLQKALNYIGKEYYQDYMNMSDDTIIAVSLYHLANSYYLMKEMGYLYSFNKKIKDFSKSSNKVCKVVDKIKDFDFMKYTKFLVEKTGNDTKEQILAYKEIMMANYDYYLNNTKLGPKYYEIMFHVLDKALELNHLNKEQKNDLMNLKNKVIKRKNMDI